MSKPVLPGSGGTHASIIVAGAFFLWLLACFGMARSEALERAALKPLKAQPVYPMAHPKVQPVQPVAQPVAQPDRVWLEQLILNAGLER